MPIRSARTREHGAEICKLLGLNLHHYSIEWSARMDYSPRGGSHVRITLCRLNFGAASAASALVEEQFTISTVMFLKTRERSLHALEPSSHPTHVDVGHAPAALEF